MSNALSSMFLKAFKMSLSVEKDGEALERKVDLCNLGHMLKIIEPNFSPRNYGEEKLRHLVQKFDTLIALEEDSSVYPPRYFARLKAVPCDEVPMQGVSPCAVDGVQGVYDNIKRFAYIQPQKYKDLSVLALEEKWYIGNAPRVGSQFELLENYINYTYIRLSHEGKILFSKSGKYASFNTGLADVRYKSIYAFFERNRNNMQPWFLRTFCIPGEDDGKLLVNEFAILPEAADYFSNPQDFIYNLHAGSPYVDWEHVIIENADRLPKIFFERLNIKNFVCKDCARMDEEEVSSYIASLSSALAADKRAHRTALSLFKGALDDALQKVRWNYKTAIPMYYPKDKKVNLLLPLSLVEDEKTDVALVVERTDSGSYQAHTILPLEWAYQNARLICRPDSDWLSTSLIESEKPAE